MQKHTMTEIKEIFLYDVHFDSISPSSDNPDDDYYDQVIYYDGGDVGEKEEGTKGKAYFMVDK